MEVQIFGTRKDAETRKALRYFSERRIRTHFVDLAEKGASRGELSRFAQKFGVLALIDREGKAFRESGLGAATYSDERWLERLVANPGLLRTPLVRCGKFLTIGVDETTWTSWRGS